MAIIPLIDKLRSVGEVLAAHQEHRHRYEPLELSKSWLALGQIVGHDQLEQQQLRRCPTVLESLTAHTLQTAHTMQACHLPRAVLGMAQLQRVADNALWRPTAALWSSLAARGVEVEFTPHQLVDTAAAFAKAQNPAPELHQALAAEATWRLGEFSPQQIAPMAWAHASAGHADPGLLKAIAKQAARRASEFKPRELANLHRVGVCHSGAGGTGAARRGSGAGDRLRGPLPTARSCHPRVGFGSGGACGRVSAC